MSPSVKGTLMFMTSSFFFGLMGLFVKLASPYLPASEIALARFATGIMVTLVLFGLGKVDISSGRKWLLVTRGVSGGLAIILLFAAMKTGTLTNVTVLNNTYPIFATVIAAFYLREKINRAVILPLVISIAGIFILTPVSITEVRTGDLLALTSALVAGFSVVVIRELRKTESVWSVFFYLSVFGTVFSGILSLADFVVPSPKGWALIAMVAVMGTAGQIINTAAYRYCSVSVGSVLSMSTSVYSAILGLVFLGDRLTLTEFAGAVLILVSSGFIAYFGSREPQTETGRLAIETENVEQM